MVPILTLMTCRNGLHMTREAVKSVFAQERLSDLLILDNGSTDGTAEYLHSLPIEVASIFVNLPSVAACWNYGMSYAFRRGYKKVFCINSDIFLREDNLQWLDDDGGEFVTCVSVRTKEQLGKYGTPPTSRRPHPDYSAFLISKEVWEKVPFNEDYLVAYGEDADHHIRLHRAGYNAVSLDVPFIHYGSGTLKNSNPAEARRIQRAADANRQRFAATYGCKIGSPEYYAMFA